MGAKRQSQNAVTHRLSGMSLDVCKKKQKNTLLGIGLVFTKRCKKKTSEHVGCLGSLSVYTQE